MHETRVASSVLLVTYGLRLGEVLGLSWDDIDFDAGTIRVRQQLQRVRREFLLGPVKTQAGKRSLLCSTSLVKRSRNKPSGRPHTARPWDWPDIQLVFTTRTGHPVEPRNLARSFRRICDSNNVRLIKVYHLRHTVGSLLKDHGVPARGGQAILGHSRISTTLEIYTDADEQARRNALTRLHDLFDKDED